MNRIQLSGCAIIQEEKILALFKTSRKYFELPGGKVEANESLEETAKRECFEELGCKIKLKKYLGNWKFSIGKQRFASHTFSASFEKNCKPKLMEPHKFSELKWIKIKEFKKFKLAPNLKQFCKDYLSGKLRPLLGERTTV